MYASPLARGYTSHILFLHTERTHKIISDSLHIGRESEIIL